MGAAMFALSFAGPMAPAEAAKGGKPNANANAKSGAKGNKRSKGKSNAPASRAKARAAQVAAAKGVMHMQYRGTLAQRSRDAMKARVATGKPASSVQAAQRPGFFTRVGAFFSNLFGGKAKAEARRGTVVSVELDRLVYSPVTGRAGPRDAN